MSEAKKGGVVVPETPQVSVEIDEHGDITVSVARISDDFQRVELQEIVFPAHCAKEVAEGILDILKP